MALKVNKQSLASKMHMTTTIWEFIVDTKPTLVYVCKLHHPTQTKILAYDACNLEAILRMTTS